MNRIRNAVVILVLCIISGTPMMDGPLLTMPGDELRDTIAGSRASRPGLDFGQSQDGELRDAIANSAAEGGVPQQFSNPDGGVGAPPRGSGNGGFGPQGNQIGNELPPIEPPGPPLSQSAPEEEKPFCDDERECYLD